MIFSQNVYLFISENMANSNSELCLHFFCMEFMIFISSFSTVTTVREPRYVVSQRGKFNLIHNDYKYVSNVSQESKKGKRWRCSHTSNRRYICKAKALTFKVDGVEHAHFIGPHTHWDNSNSE